MSPTRLFEALFGQPVTAEAIRSEIYFLGARHRGEALSGAVNELVAGATPSRQRRRLLRAVIDELKRGEG